MLSLFRSWESLDCLQSSSSLTISLALITARVTANNDATRLGFACSNFAKKSKRLLLVYSPELTRVISTFWCITIEGSRVRRHNGVLIIQFSFSKMFVNLLFLTPKGHHSVILIKNLSIIPLMDSSNCIISFNTKIFVILLPLLIPIALICVTGFIVLLTSIKHQKLKRVHFPWF